MFEFRNFAFKRTSQKFSKIFGQMLGRPATPLFVLVRSSRGCGRMRAHGAKKKGQALNMQRAGQAAPKEAGRPSSSVHIPSPPKGALSPASLGARLSPWIIWHREAADRPVPGQRAWPLRPAIKSYASDALQCTRSLGLHASFRARSSHLPS